LETLVPAQEFGRNCFSEKKPAIFAWEDEKVAYIRAPFKNF
jgi:hypothetical protein